jgi:hypothetical protein
VKGVGGWGWVNKITRMYAVGGRLVHDVIPLILLVCERLPLPPILLIYVHLVTTHIAQIFEMVATFSFLICE